VADRVRLDTRPLRRDLTSRECCSILGGVIGGMIDAWGVETTRDLVRAYTKILQGVSFASSYADLNALDGRPGAREMGSILSATIACLCENCRPSVPIATNAAIAGCIWWAERTDAEWEQIVKPRTPGGSG
jgi:hypothetical protein